MSRSLRAALFAAVSVLSVVGQSADAAVITKTYTFAASDFQSSSGDNALPYTTANGSFTITFDDAANYLNSPIIIVNSLNIPYASFALFSYTESVDAIQIGSAGSTASMSANSADFRLSFFNAARGTPFSARFDYTAVGYNGFAGARTVSVTSTNVAPGVPEPATWAMMMLGFGGIGLATRRKKVTTRVRFA